MPRPLSIPSFRFGLTIPSIRHGIHATVAVACLGLASPALQASEWSQVTVPSEGPTRAIGQTNNGCIAGAHALPLEGDGYRVMHIERNRFYGHPKLLRIIETLGRRVEEQGLGELPVGDLGQPRGGPMPFGHRSHQTGLDVDIWFSLDPKLFDQAGPLRADAKAPSMLASPRKGLDRTMWTAKQASVLEMAANLAGVDRIFVNPWIKKELCGQGEGQWLRKIRPWYYHDDHFHLRMACPEGSPSCERQEALPAGDGCDASLDWWFNRLPETPTKAPPPPRPNLPGECRELLGEP